MTTTERFASATPGRPAPPPAPHTPPEDARRRRWPWVLLALVAVGVLTFSVTRWVGDRHEVAAWQVTEDLPPGTRIGTDNAHRVRIDADQQVDGLISTLAPPKGVARTQLRAGSLLTESLVSSEELLSPPKGRALAGLQLSAAQTPAGNVVAGDLVDLLATPPQEGDTSGQPAEPLVSGVEVWSVGEGQDGTVVMTVAVPSRILDNLTSLAASGRVSVVRSR